MEEMTARFVNIDHDTPLLLPPDLRDWVSEDHMVHFVMDHAFPGGSWNDREGMVLANNLLYSREANALNFPQWQRWGGDQCNGVVGAGPKQGCFKGRGPEDLPGLDWQATQRDATPAADAPLQEDDPRYLLETDFHGNRRTLPWSGAVARP